MENFGVKDNLRGLSSGEQFFLFVLVVVSISDFYFFAADGAVDWNIAISIEIPTVGGRRLRISDDTLFEV